MQALGGELECEVTKKGETKKKKKPTKKKKKGPSTAVAARTLRQQGVLRLNGVLSAETATGLREEILERRTAAYAACASSTATSDPNEWRKYFADVLLKKERCDLFLPLKGEHTLQKALHELLVTSNILYNVLVTALGGDDVTLYELSALISEPGSPRQPVHPDNPYQDQPPLITVFIALQDITLPMGPTTFIPRSNTPEAHAVFNGSVPQRDAFLQQKPSLLALLQSGDASLFDSRTLHCGTANDGLEGATRVLLYMSFRNPRATEPIGNVGSLHPTVPRGTTLQELRSFLSGV